MNQKHIKFLSIIVLLLLMVVFPSQGSARLWQFGNGFHYAVDRVCRDGADMIAAFWLGNGHTIPAIDEMLLSAQQYHNDNLPDPQNTSYPPNVLYGPLLDRQFVPITYHDEPLPADTDNDGTMDKMFQIYGSGTLNWSSLLDVGDLVMFSGSDELVLPVEDCYLDQLTVEQNVSTIIDATQLFMSDDLTDDDSVVYQVNTLPSYGTIQLAGVALAVGDTFTQNDINSNRLTYQHDGSATTNDSFTFHLRATTQVSVDSNGTPGNNDSTNPSIAGNGRTIVFQSSASNLVAGDTNGTSDIFVHNQSEDTTTRESIAFDGTQADGASFNPAVDDSYILGKYAVVFESYANNLIDPVEACGGGGATRHIFQRIQDTSTKQYSVSSFIGQCDNADGNASNPAIAEYGNSSSMVFETNATNLIPEQDQNSNRDVYNVQSQTLSLVSMAANTDVAANAPSFAPAISGDGRHVAFASAANNLIDDDTNNQVDIFIRSDDQNVRVSVSSDDTQTNRPSYTPALSFDGRYVAFASESTNLVDGDTNNDRDIFVRDRDTDEDGIFDEPGAVSTIRISVASDGSQANGASFAPSISANGRYIAFESLASNLVNGDTNDARDIFVHDRWTSATNRVSVAADGTEANATSSGVDISATGSYVVFESDATNLVEDDTNKSTDVFVHYLGFSSEFTLTIEPSSSVYLPLITR